MANSDDALEEFFNPRKNPFNRLIAVIGPHGVVGELPRDWIIIREAFEELWMEGDEVWFYESGSWAALAGRMGYMLLRGNDTIAKRNLFMS